LNPGVTGGAECLPNDLYGITNQAIDVGFKLNFRASSHVNLAARSRATGNGEDFFIQVTA
jgi:hypothetical protein